jgi:hypothetical protein
MWDWEELRQKGVVTGSTACGTGRNWDREEWGHEGKGTGRSRDKKKIETGMMGKKGIGTGRMLCRLEEVEGGRS